MGLKKIMFLGGAVHQVPVLQYATSQGYYTILCDYLKDNIGQNYADKFYCVDTMDQEAILEIAEEESIEGIIAYASDSAIDTLAYVAEKMKLPAYSSETISLLSNKNLFREFLKRNGFNSPKSKSFSSLKDIENELQDLRFPLIVKPVDSGGSRGIVSINHLSELEQAFKNALSVSVQKKVIVEEFIEMKTDFLVGGEIIVLDGDIKYMAFLNGHRDIENNRCIPIGNSFPTHLTDENSKLVQQQIQKVIDLLDIKFGALNIDVVFDKNDQLYIIEINARNGANMISELLQKATKVNLVELSVEMAMGKIEHDLPKTVPDKFYSTFYLRSYKKGKLKHIELDGNIKENIVSEFMYKDCGDEVEQFDGLDKIIGILLFQFKDMDEMKEKMKKMDSYINVQVIG